VRSLRRLIDDRLLPSHDAGTVWIRWIPSKANILLWRVLCDPLGTKDYLARRGVETGLADCQMCNAREESLDHVMALCSTTRLVAAYMARWIEWWSVNEASAQALWTAICNDNIKEDPFSKLVRKAICVAFFWMM